MPLLLYVGDSVADAGNPDQHTSGQDTPHGSAPRTSDGEGLTGLDRRPRTVG
ncbi:hypothetical protein [Streptomyces sp. NPDC001930]|uniref:hypothetical protein n=1 Tax=Streptomyces sp. NPDC001930 TaxID=3364625 RepID=UPI00368B6FBB